MSGQSSETENRVPENRVPEVVDRLGGGLINLVLGALILWVGQTTFRHAGLLASVDQKFEGVGNQFDAVDQRHDTGDLYASVPQQMVRARVDRNHRIE